MTDLGEQTENKVSVKKKSIAKKSDPNKVILKREKKIIAVFIDGVGLDRASRRLKKKVNLSALVKSLSYGIDPEFARYYTIIPFEDDSRHRAFLDAVSRSGLSVLAKRLPPKNIERQIAIDSELSCDLISFGLNHTNQYDLSSDKIELLARPLPFKENNVSPSAELLKPIATDTEKTKRIAIIVCPSRELSYAIGFLNHIKVDTVSADFADFAGNDVLKSAAKWIDLSDSQTIWQD